MNYLIQHPEVVWSGIGVFLLGGLIALIKFLKKKFNQKYKIVKVNECSNNESLKKDLTFVNGIYSNNYTNERFCPLCLDSDKLLIHLTEKNTSNGTVFECYRCGKLFLGADYDPNKNNSNDGFMTW